ncbi:Cytochrome b-c1 complex subunit [Lachnellula subtilissima]|uniref:Cytochrome b-c1 complex subunit n=1 Tax=Lachnellula subtilissima TaxID=602034 RepID=A0A8H8RJS2_9HELO|nr:Cytochrome b-c1 complex subunit [Lachnellula subtilissima]
MGFFDIVAAAMPWSESEAEAVSGGSSTDSTPANSGGEAKDPSGPTPDDKDEVADEGEDKEEGGEKEEEEEEEEEEEMVDPKETFEEECKESKACAPSKHHFEECVERVTGNTDSKAPHEDCVEECTSPIATSLTSSTLPNMQTVFHLAHCANQCAAPKLWAALK